MLTALLAFLIFIAVLLAIPISLVYRVSWRGHWQANVHLFWMFGLLHVRIPTATTPPSAKAKHTRHKPARRQKPRTRRTVNPLAAWRLHSFRRRILKFLHDLWRAIHKRDVRLQLLIGMGDPADTGRLWAVVGPVSALLGRSREVRIHFEPEFTETCFEFSSSGNIRVIPVQLLGLTLALLVSPVFWYGMRQLRRTR